MLYVEFTGDYWVCCFINYVCIWMSKISVKKCHKLFRTTKCISYGHINYIYAYLLYRMFTNFGDIPPLQSRTTTISYRSWILRTTYRMYWELFSHLLNTCSWSHKYFYRGVYWWVIVEIFVFKNLMYSLTFDKVQSTFSYCPEKV